ncbi:hypothetical protein QTV49_001740 [Vibrio vulnificus]|nr:hypothetical protein [Vibrio vulnificus]
MKKPIWFISLKTESGDEYVFGYWRNQPSEKEVAAYIVENLSNEVSYYVIDDGKTMDWAKENPVEAIELALIYPDLKQLNEI